MNTESDREYLELLKSNNAQLKKIADALDTLVLHYIENIGGVPANNSVVSNFVPAPLTKDRTNPLYYIKSHVDADTFIRRCIEQARAAAPEERLISSRSILKLLRHDYSIPEGQIILLTPGLDKAIRNCGLVKVSKMAYLIEEDKGDEQGSPSILQEA